MISVLQFATLDYATSLQLQKKLVDLRKEDRIGDTLLLLEHPPVITLGRNAKATNIVASVADLSRRGVKVFESDRGGDVTFHGPGQLVGYPIFDLRAFPSSEGKRRTLGVIEYVRRIEEVLIRTCADFGIYTERVCKLTGVWTQQRPVEGGPYTSEQAKIAAIGVHISNSVTSHGFALNVDTDLDYFKLIIPCGIASKPVTSMAEELVKPVDAVKVANSIVRHFGEVFQSQILWVETLDALLNQIGVPMRIPQELRRLQQEDDPAWA